MSLKVALVHDWLIHMRGGEKVLESLYEVFPEAEIFTLFYDRRKLSPALKGAKIHGSFLQLLPGIRSYYRWLLPIMPLAIKSFSLKGYDVVISSSHCVAKGCRVPAGTLHVCYCHTPIRYVWGFRQDYFNSFPIFLKAIIHWVLDQFKGWDLSTNRKVQFFIANSENTRKRIEKFYKREAFVVYPPVNTAHFKPQDSSKTGDYFLLVSAFVPYKRIDLAIEAFNRLGYPLTIVGDGPERSKLQRKAASNVRFLGSLSDEELKVQYEECRALIFPGEEDFGIVPVEAQAFGKPVIAYAMGGALETVTDGTGVFFAQQTPEALIRAVKRFETLSFHAEVIRNNALRFDRQVFQQKIREVIPTLYNTWRNSVTGKGYTLDNHSALVRK